jgi:uncharacterized RDD family membrane protein YckC
MSAKTFLYIRGKKEGPYSHQEIQEKLKRGEIGLYDTAEDSGKNILVKQLLQSSNVKQPEPPSFTARENHAKVVQQTEPIAHSIAPQNKPAPLLSQKQEQPSGEFVKVELASPGSRLAAQILDGLLNIIVLLPAFIGGVAFVGGQEQKNGKGQELYAILLLLGLFLWLVLTLVQCVFLCSNGQTLGKKMMGIRILNSDDLGNPGFGRVFLLRYCANTVLTMIPWIGWIYWLIDLLFIFRGDRRCVHDLMAMTRVIRN